MNLRAGGATPDAVHAGAGLPILPCPVSGGSCMNLMIRGYLCGASFSLQYGASSRELPAPPKPAAHRIEQDDAGRMKVARVLGDRGGRSTMAE